MKIIRVFIGILSVVFIFTIIYVKGDKNVEVEGVDFTYPAKRRLEQLISFPGNLMFEKEVEVKTQISGVIDRIFVEVGDTVAMGTKLATIRLVSDPLSIDRLESQYSIAQDNMKKTLLDFDRQKQLFEKGVIAPIEFEEAERRLSVIKHEVSQIQHELNMLRATDEASNMINVITSTTDGVVLELPLKEGSFVTAINAYSAGSTIAKIADPGSMIFKGFIGEGDIHLVRPFMKLQLEILALKKRKLNAILNVISPKGIPKDGGIKFEILATIISEQNVSDIKPGYSAYAHATVAGKDSVISVEEKFVDYRGDSTFLSVDSGNGLSESRYIQTGISDGVYVEIISGIEADDKVVLANDDFEQ